jgi:hypothetical protein
LASEGSRTPRLSQHAIIPAVAHYSRPSATVGAKGMGVSKFYLNVCLLPTAPEDVQAALEAAMTPFRS